jgi:hypothetical protein
MKAIGMWCGACVLLAISARADEIRAHITGGGVDKTLVVTTNEVSLYRLNWDGLEGGGQDDILVVRDNAKVTVIRKAGWSHQGIGGEETDKTHIPLAKLPYTIPVDAKTVTVFRVEQKIEESPNKAPDDTARKLADPQR